MDIIDNVKAAVADGRLTETDGIAEIAFRLNADEPRSLKMGWPLVTSIEVAARTLGVEAYETADVEARFLFDDPRETGAILVVGNQVYPWPGCSPITVTGAGGRGTVNWAAIGDVIPQEAAQFAKALRLAAAEAHRLAEALKG